MIIKLINLIVATTRGAESAIARTNPSIKVPQFLRVKSVGISVSCSVPVHTREETTYLASKYGRLLSYGAWRNRTKMAESGN